MAKINGTLYVVYGDTNKLLHSTDATLNVDVDLPLTTNKESGGWNDRDIDGVRDWSIDVNGLYDESGSGVTPDEVMAAIIARTTGPVIQFKPTSGGTKGWTGNGKYKNFKLSAGLETPLGYSLSIVSNGALALIT